jgi:hypothetical protein
MLLRKLKNALSANQSRGQSSNLKIHNEQPKKRTTTLEQNSIVVIS